MTSERRTIVSLGDIQAVCFQCKTCATKVSVQPEKLSDAIGIMDECPACKKHWWSIKATSLPERSAASFVAFLKALQQLRTPEASEAVGFTLSLEFDEPGR